MAKLFANSGDPDQTPRSAASDLGLHCLPVTLLRAQSPDYNGLNNVDDNQVAGMHRINFTTSVRIIAFCHNRSVCTVFALPCFPYLSESRFFV